jgi:hypothetical protein
MYGIFVKKIIFIINIPNEELSEGSDLGPELPISGSPIITLHICMVYMEPVRNQLKTDTGDKNCGNPPHPILKSVCWGERGVWSSEWIS